MCLTEGNYSPLMNEACLSSQTRMKFEYFTFSCDLFARLTLLHHLIWYGREYEKQSWNQDFIHISNSLHKEFYWASIIKEFNILPSLTTSAGVQVLFERELNKMFCSLLWINRLFSMIESRRWKWKTIDKLFFAPIFLKK